MYPVTSFFFKNKKHTQYGKKHFCGIGLMTLPASHQCTSCPALWLAKRANKQISTGTGISTVVYIANKLVSQSTWKKLKCTCKCWYLAF